MPRHRRCRSSRQISRILRAADTTAHITKDHQTVAAEESAERLTVAHPGCLQKLRIRCASKPFHNLIVATTRAL
jgi:hypothetical protein